MVVAAVRGPLAEADMGRTLMHEHVFVLNQELIDNTSGPEWNESEAVEDAVVKLEELYEGGITTIVDPTIVGLGRYIPRIQKVASRVRINIVVGTGVYAFAEMPHFFRYHGPGTLLGGEDPLLAMLLRDVNVGIGDTGVKAAFVKCVTEAEGLTADVERIMSATCTAHGETGAPILTHSNSRARTGLLQQDFFEDRGVDLTRVLIGHSGDSDDLTYLTAMAERGSLLGMDRFGLHQMLPMAERVSVVAEMCRRGFASQMVLSHDTACFTDVASARQREEFLPDWHYMFIPTQVLPALREAQVSEEDIDAMLVHNPRRFFETSASSMI